MILLAHNDQDEEGKEDNDKDEDGCNTSRRTQRLLLDAVR